MNLSGIKSGPIYEQTQALLKKIQDKNNVFYTRWRDVQIYEFPTWIKANTDIRRSELKAAIQEAHKRGVKVTGHLRMSIISSLTSVKISNFLITKKSIKQFFRTSLKWSKLNNNKWLCYRGCQDLAPE